MRVASVIVAGGRGSRMGGDVPKQWRAVAGRAVADHAAEPFRALGPVVLVHHPDDAEPAASLGLTTVEGGATRMESVRAGLDALAADPPDVVLIHDAARPCVTGEVIARVLSALDGAEAAAPALPVTDALWRGDRHVEQAVSRDGLWRAQTPQGFRFAPLLAAHRAFWGDAADDVEVARAANMAVAIVRGDEDNLKVTNPGDLERAARILEARSLANLADVRTGQGFDVHAFGPGDGVTLCGVRIPFERGLVAHSDGDVGLHALTDAVLGALGEGDIGAHFPPSDPQWADADSTQFLRRAGGIAAQRGYRVSNADVTLVCEAPKVGPHVEAMRTAIAGCLGIEPSRVAVKATTSERMGFTGRGEGIAALAVATLVRP